jgi:hypothetical protein
MIGLLIALLAAAPAEPGLQWRVYYNARYGTGLAYPADLFGARTESDNGDGVRFRAADGATLAVFGTHSDATPDAYVAGIVTGNPHYRNLSYRVVRANFAVLSGRDGNRLYYERYAFGEPAGVVQAFVLDYPASARIRYAAIIPHMSASLHGSPR